MLEILKNTGIFVLGAAIVAIGLGGPILLLVNVNISRFGYYSWIGFGIYFLISMTYIGLVISTIKYWINK